MNQIKKGTRLYINLTNNCNTDCPFCCMYSGTNKNTFMDFETFKNIIDNTDGNFELQLEGGEPILNKNIFLFIEYAIATSRCTKVLILSNGLELKKYMKRFIDIANWNKILFEFKISINYHLINTQKDFLYNLNLLLFSVKFLEYIKITFNVRKRNKGDENLEEKLKKYGLFENSNIYYLQSYGKLSGSDYDKPVIVQNIDNWKIYACDGTCFEQDLIARSNYEGGLS